MSDLQTALASVRQDIELAEEFDSGDVTALRRLEVLLMKLERLEKGDFQPQVAPWMEACFGQEIANDLTERNHRFLEEALELVQSTGCTKSDAHALVEYVYGRPMGSTHQEVGGVMVTLAALCNATLLDMHEAGDDELSRVWRKVGEIRAKQAAKPRGSALPQTWHDPRDAKIETLRANLSRMVEHFGLWARDHSEEASSETWSVLHCARVALEGKSDDQA